MFFRNRIHSKGKDPSFSAEQKAESRSVLDERALLRSAHIRLVFPVPCSTKGRARERRETKVPSKAMREAAALPSQCEYGGVKYDRMQFLTVKDILEDKREFHAPTKMVSRISTAQGSLALYGGIV